MSNPQKLPPGLLDLLVLEGITSISAADRIREKVRSSWTPIGKILRDRGHLTMDEMLRILELQATEPHLRLGELAVREGLCTEQHIEEALREQRRAAPHLLEVVLSDVPCDREKLCRVLVRYIRQLEARGMDAFAPA